MAKKPKQYYWLKLKDDFFRQKEIKKLRKIAGGDTYTIIYLKMLLLAIKEENKLYFEGVEDEFADELALELDEDEENVAMTLAFLDKHNLIEIVNDEEFFLPQAEEMTGSESESAARVRRHREKKKNPQLIEQKEPKSGALRQKQFRAKKKCEEKQHIPMIEDYLNNKRYNGNYYLVLQRDKYKCSICGSIENLCVHHIDGYDEHKPQNNDTNKMITLCRHCHSNIHAGVNIDEDILDSIDYFSNEMLPGNVNVTQCNTDVTPSNKNVTTEKEKEKEKEKELDSKSIDKEKNQTDGQALSKFSKIYESNIGVINQLTGQWLIEMTETIDYPLFKRAIEICTERGNLNLGYLKGVIKRWLDNNITTYDQLKAYELQTKAKDKPRQQESAEKQNMDFLDRLEEKFKVSNGNDAIDPNSERYKRMLELERELEGDD